MSCVESKAPDLEVGEEGMPGDLSPSVLCVVEESKPTKAV